MKWISLPLPLSLSPSLPLNLPFHLSTYPFLYSIISLSTSIFIHPLIRPSVHPSIHQSINQSINQSVNQSIQPSIYQSLGSGSSHERFAMPQKVNPLTPETKKRNVTRPTMVCHATRRKRVSGMLITAGLYPFHMCTIQLVDDQVPTTVCIGPLRRWAATNKQHSIPGLSQSTAFSSRAATARWAVINQQRSVPGPRQHANPLLGISDIQLHAQRAKKKKELRSSRRKRSGFHETWGVPAENDGMLHEEPMSYEGQDEPDD
jgi:hypothetical protein